MDIINGKGSTEFGIGQALSVLCLSILQDENVICRSRPCLKASMARPAFTAASPAR